MIQNNKSLEKLGYFILKLSLRQFYLDFIEENNLDINKDYDTFLNLQKDQIV